MCRYPLVIASEKRHFVLHKRGAFLVMDKYTFCFASLQQSQTEQDVENKYFDNYSDMAEYATNRLPDESEGVWIVDINEEENEKRSYFITNDLDDIKRYISSATPATKMTIFEWEDYETCGQSMCDLAEGLTDNVWDEDLIKHYKTKKNNYEDEN